MSEVRGHPEFGSPGLQVSSGLCEQYQLEGRGGAKGVGGRREAGDINHGLQQTPTLVNTLCVCGGGGTWTLVNTLCQGTWTSCPTRPAIVYGVCIYLVHEASARLMECCDKGVRQPLQFGLVTNEHLTSISHGNGIQSAAAVHAQRTASIHLHHTTTSPGEVYTHTVSVSTSVS